MANDIETVVNTPTAPTPKPKSDAELTSDQQTMYSKVLQHFADATYKLPGVEASAELTELEKFWLSYECILRFLRATKWKVEVSISRLESTLRWRRDYGIYSHVTAEHVEPEATTGKEIIFGYDVKGRPAFYMIPSRQNTSEAKRQIEFAVWMFERSIDLMDQGVESIDLLIDFSDKAKNPSLSTARAVLSILQDHYPERLGLGLIINVPYLVNLFFNLISPFIDPVTRSKIKFNPQVVDDGIFEADNVMQHSWGGSVNFAYDHDQYWPALVNLTESRSTQYLQNWRELGGTVGIKEWDYKAPRH